MEKSSDHQHCWVITRQDHTFVFKKTKNLPAPQCIYKSILCITKMQGMTVKAGNWVEFNSLQLFTIPSSNYVIQYFLLLLKLEVLLAVKKNQDFWKHLQRDMSHGKMLIALT